MFGMVTATGIKILAKVDYSNNRYNLYIMVISIGMAMIPVVSTKFFSKKPEQLDPLLHSGNLLATISAVELNAYFRLMEFKEAKKKSGSEVTGQLGEGHKGTNSGLRNGIS
jgi:uric acid transporter